MAQVVGVEPEQLEEAGRADAAAELRKLLAASTADFTPSADPGAPASSEGGVTIPLEAVRQLVGPALIQEATSIRQHAEAVLAANPGASGRDIFPSEAELAELWDNTPSLPVAAKSRYAAIWRLGMEQRKSG